MSGINCVVFDIGNVLVRWDPCNLYRRMGYRDATGVLYRRMGYRDAETAAILTEIGLLEINHRVLDAGGPFPATLELLVERFPRHADFIRAFDKRWVESLGGIIPGSVAIFHRLKQAGVPVHALSNSNRQKFNIAREVFPFLMAFDELLLSGDVGLVKPDAEIFELLVRRCGLDVDRTVFIDDSGANVATAARLGFATIHFNEKTTGLRAELLRSACTRMRLL